MSNLKIVAVDSGKNKTKAVRIENGEYVNRFSIDTKIIETVEEVSHSRASFAVRLNDKTYLVGDQSAEYNAVTSKAQDVHKYATYLAVSRMVEDGDEVVLVVGCPINLYLNKEKREDYVRFMLNLPENHTATGEELKTTQSDIELAVNGSPFNFRINRLLVVPETAGYLVKHEEKFLGRDVAIVDIGGLNVNGAVYQTISNYDGTEEVELLQMVDSSVFTLEDGCNIFANKLQDILNKAYDAGINSMQMQRIIQQGYIRNDKEGSAKLISMHKRNFFEAIKQRMQGRKWSTKTLDFVFVGGGSLLFKEDILIDKDFSEAIISETAQWDNVEGFAIVGEDLVYMIQEAEATVK